MDTVASISPRSLQTRIGSARSPLVLDVRDPADFSLEARMIPAALQPEADIVAIAAGHAAGRPIALYCREAGDVSREAARVLSRAGYDAAYVEGGLAAWLREGCPTLRRKPEWGVPGSSRWITRARPKVDRVACPWLIRRFADPLARFDYVPADRVLEEAQARGAVAFDLPGAPVGHRGERCSFDALIEAFELHDRPLDRLARIVRGADTGRPDLAPQCEGLLAASLGLSERFADDHEMLEAAMPLYDGLYAWCRREEERIGGDTAAPGR